MRASQSKPVIFLAYANDRQPGGGYLRNLGQEATRVQECLESAYEEQLCDIVIRMGVTPEGMIKVFNDPHLKNRIAIFHFAGHADDYLLLLEGARGEVVATDAQALAGYLHGLLSLQVVFLNACSTRAQVDDLLAAGVSLVIATSDAIEDELAAEFAVQFYTSLAAGEKLQIAFDKAQQAVKFIHSELIRQVRPVEDEHASNDLPWALYVRPGAETVLDWDLPAAANNPLFGLPVLPAGPLPQNPYRHLEWYRSEDAAIFFGRGREIRQLYRAITTPGTAPLILLCGQSGVGKSSLLAAGLLPRLAASHTVHYLRRKPEVGLTGTLQESLACAPEPEAFVAAWLATEQRANQPLFMVLDQVEEVYTHPQPAADADELAQFLQCVQTLFVNAPQKPGGKLLLGFRKEWLAEIEKSVAAHGIWHVTEFLDRLDRQGVIEVIAGPLQTPQLQTHYKLQLPDDDLPRLIADDLLADHGSVVAPTLQILLHTMWQRASQDQGKPVFDRTLYHELRQEGLGLGDFLDQQLAQLAEVQPQAVASGLVLDLLHFHITALDTAAQREADLLRTRYTYQQERLNLLQTYRQQLGEYLKKHQPHLVWLVKPGIMPQMSAREWEQARARLIQNCVARNLLTVVTAQPAGPAATRLAHDTLAPLVRDRFEKSIAPGQRAHRILENRAVDWAENKNGVPLDDADLATVEAGVQGMRRWQQAEERLIQASRVARQKRRIIRRLPWLAAAIIALLILVSEQVANILLDREQMKAAVAEAQLALNRLTADPGSAAQLVSAVLPNSTARAYVAQAEFAYTEALQQDWEVARSKQNKYLATASQVDTNSAYLALGSDTLSVVAQPELRAVTLTVGGQNILGVAWNQAGALLSYDAAQVRLWRKLESGKFGENAQRNDFPAEAGAITCAEWHPSGNQIAICQGKTLWLWCLTTDTREKIYKFPNALVGDSDQRQQRWSPSGQRLVAWDTAGTLLLWDSVTLSVTTQITVHQAIIWDVAWSSDERHLVTVSGDRTAKVWSVPALQPTDPLSLTAIAQGNSLLSERAGVKFVDEQHFLTWGFDSRVRRWNVQGNLLQSYDTRRGVVTAVRNGRTANEFLVLLADGSAQLWDLAGEAEEVTTFIGHDRQILATAWHDDYLATASMDGTARIWQAATGGELATLMGHQNGLTTGRRDLLTIAWQDDQHLVTTSMDGTVRRWRFVNGRDPFCADWGKTQPPQCYGLSHVISAHERRIVAAQWVSDTAFVSVDSQGSARLWAAGQPAQPAWELPPVKGRKARLSPNGQALFTYMTTAESDQPAGQLWNLLTRQPVATISSSPLTTTHWIDNHLLINRPTMPPVVIDGSSGLTLTTLADPGAFYSAVQLAGDQLATGDNQGHVRIWQMPGGEMLGQWPVGREDRISQLVWLAQGEQLLVATGTSTITLRNAQAGEVLWSTPLSGTVKSIAISPDEELIAIASGQAVVVLRTADGEELWSHPDPDFTMNGVQWVTRPAWSTLNFYRTLGQAVYRWFGDEPRRLADARLLLMTWGGDGIVHFWHWDSGMEVLRLRENVKPGTAGARYPVGIAALSRDRARLVTAGDSGALRFWQIWLDQPALLWGVLEARRLQLSAQPAQ